MNYKYTDFVDNSLTLRPIVDAEVRAMGQAQTVWSHLFQMERLARGNTVSVVEIYMHSSLKCASTEYR